MGDPRTVIGSDASTMATAVASNDVPEQADEAGARLYEEHAETLLGYCRTRLGSEVEAEDAVQTTFVYALRALRRGVVPDCEAAWLTTIAKNVCHWQRRTQARRGPLATGADLDAIVSLGSQPGDHDELIGLDEALASMPEQQRRALVLREWRGVAPAEIAERLDLTPTATHALLTRARSSLALALAVARQPALALVWVVGELRSLVKALVGSATAKAGVAAVTVVATTGVTAGLVEKGEPGRNADTATPVLVDPSFAHKVGTNSVSRGTPPAVSTHAARRRPAPGAPSRPTASAPAGRVTPVRRQSAPIATALQPTPPPAATPPAPTRPAGKDRSVARPAGSGSTPSPPAVPKLPVAPTLPVPTLPEVAPPTLPDVPTLPNVPSLPVPPVVEVPQAPPVSDTVAEVTGVVGQTAERILP